MTNGSSFVTGFGAGTIAMYFLDPNRGRRRRARVRDAAVHGAHLAARGAAATGRDALHRAQGVAAAARSLGRRGTSDDAVLEARVRSKLGRLISHPHAVQVTAEHGVVTLRGDILDREADGLVRHVRKIAGVRDVVDGLARAEHAGNIPVAAGRPASAGRPVRRVSAELGAGHPRRHWRIRRGDGHRRSEAARRIRRHDCGSGIGVDRASHREPGGHSRGGPDGRPPRRGCSEDDHCRGSMKIYGD